MKRVTPVVSIFARLLMALSVLSVLSLTACGDKSTGGSQEMTLSPAKSAFINTDVTGLGYARDFALTDHTGKPRTLADYKGKAVVVFFGYTQCPDVCPTTMVEMADVMKELGPLASKVQVLFVTIDPERDTQELLSHYVPAFDPSFVGLYGDQAATDKVAKEFRVFYQKVPGKTPGSYTMDHTAGSYVFDPEGHIRLFIRHGQGADPIAHDLKLLLK
ncbi:SCO family protein [Collimonas antrihumi]|uniref:SCO family protein n=1 Tax=Collimonas antrihumi TaxID=1940615 RepID=UPI001B8D2259|nr:SCO family protein [Collimonas antrihumi]